MPLNTEQVMELTKDTIQAVLAREDNVGMHAIGRALVHLFDRQTAYEQQAETTYEANSIGFSAFDGEIGASMAKQYTKRGFLTPKQVAVWRRPRKNSTTTKIGKYWKQILEIAQEKRGREVCTFKVPGETVEILFPKARKERKNWCNENVGTYADDWFFYEGHFYFRDEKDVLHYTLRWIGE